MITLRMTFLISYIICFTSPLQYLFSCIFGIFLAANDYVEIERLFFPIYYFFRFIKGTLIILYELSLPVTALICLMFRSGWNLIWSFLSLPFLLVFTVACFCSESLIAILSVFKSLGQGFRSVTTVAGPLTIAENRETTMTLLQIATQLCLDWS
jgi:hypothetical protein